MFRREEKPASLFATVLLEYYTFQERARGEADRGRGSRDQRRPTVASRDVQVQVSWRMFANESITHAWSARSFSRGAVTLCVNQRLHAPRDTVGFLSRKRAIKRTKIADTKLDGSFRERARDLARHFRPSFSSIPPARSNDSRNLGMLMIRSISSYFARRTKDRFKSALRVENFW